MKLNDSKSVVSKELCQGRPTPKFDVSSVPKRSMVKIPFIEDGQRKIFEIAMIWSTDNQKPVIPQCLSGENR